MASTSFTKRQKERARQEKQRMKTERRLQRKQEKGPGSGGGPPIDFEATTTGQTDTPDENDEGAQSDL
jgi:hypothetical protein